MKSYKVKGNCETYLEIVKKTAEGYEVEITRHLHDVPETRREFVSSQLFDTCLATGYLSPVAAPAAAMSA